jgi:hypothetical protein
MDSLLASLTRQPLLLRLQVFQRDRTRLSGGSAHPARQTLAVDDHS